MLLSLLDQAISFADDKLLLEDVLTVTGAVLSQALTDIINAIIQGETVDVLTHLRPYSSRRERSAKVHRGFDLLFSRYATL